MNIPEGGLIIVALGGNAIERADKKGPTDLCFSLHARRPCLWVFPAQIE